MTQQSEDRLDQPSPGSAAADAGARTSAQILQFERPQSSLQRAIQQRAQEAMEIERDREREAKKPAPLRWVIILAIASIPVFLIFGAVDGFVRVIRQVSEMQATQQPASTPAPVQRAPAAQSESGVVMLESYEPAPAAEGETATPAE